MPGAPTLRRFCTNAAKHAGRKPKALYYARELAEAEGRIIDALPGIIDRLVEQAQAGDVAAARYLLDRVFGRVQLQGAPIADDTELPFEEEDLEAAQKGRVNERKIKSLCF
jgi:hypothetical protein